MTWTLTGFADEIDPDLSVQLATIATESLRYLELRGVWGTNVADLDSAQLDKLAAGLAEAGVSVSAIGSPVGKIAVDAPLEPELERLRRVAGVAHRFGTDMVRVFSFFLPPGTPPERFREPVLARMGALASVAAAEGVVLAHENEKGIYGDRPERCREILDSVASPALRSTFDAANFVQCGVRPHTDAYQLLRPYLCYVQVKDALAATGEVVPAGQGDGEVRETLQALADSGFDGFFSLEPHLKRGGRFGGFSGPDRFRTAVQALKALFQEIGVPWA